MAAAGVSKDLICSFRKMWQVKRVVSQLCKWVTLRKFMKETVPTLYCYLKSRTNKREGYWTDELMAALRFEARDNEIQSAPRDTCRK